MPNTQSRKLLGLTALALRDPPAPPAPKRGPGPPKRITAKLERAIHAMVWEGLRRDDAARAAGFAHPDALYKAFRKPHVKSAYLAECEVLRTSAIARNLHLLEGMAESSANDMARIAAIRQMGKPDEIATNRASIGVQSPGLTIVIEGTGAREPVIVENTEQAPD